MGSVMGRLRKKSTAAVTTVPATIAIENARLHQTEMESERMRRDLELAAALQRQILPQRLPAGPSYELDAMTSPCRTVGGDFYDAIDGGSGRLILVVADASGKGIGAALLVSTFQAALHTYVEFGLSLSQIPPPPALSPVFLPPLIRRRSPSGTSTRGTTTR